MATWILSIQTTGIQSAILSVWIMIMRERYMHSKDARERPLVFLEKRKPVLLVLKAE
jgi:hypothetical protein